MTRRDGIATVADFVSHDRLDRRRSLAWLRDKATGYRVVWLRRPIPVNLARKASRALARPVAAPTYTVRGGWWHFADGRRLLVALPREHAYAFAAFIGAVPAAEKSAAAEKNCGATDVEPA